MYERVYISGPISNGGTADAESRLANVHAAEDVFVALVRLGFAPLAPQLTEHLDRRLPGAVEYHQWLAIDFPWVRVAQAVLRLPGESSGADAEVREARRCGVPVFFSVEELVQGIQFVRRAAGRHRGFAREVTQ